MTWRLRVGTALLVAWTAAIGSAAVSAGSGQTTGPRVGKGTAAVGQPAPGFSLIDINGKQLDLAAFRGRVVLLDFWATWCAPCLVEIPRFVDLQNKYRDRGLQIVGISLDDEATPVRAFYQKLKMNYPVAVGDAALAERYGGVLGLPLAFVIGCDGRIEARRAGETPVAVIERDITKLLLAPTCKPTVTPAR